MKKVMTLISLGMGGVFRTNLTMVSCHLSVREGIELLP